MNLYLIILVLIAILLLVLILWARKEAKRHGTSTGEEIVGICTIALDRTVRKRANMDKIIALFREKPEISNSEIREATGIGRRAVVRYLDNLEAEGRIEQIGGVGRGVVYRPK